MKQVKSLIALLLVLAIGIYLYAIIEAGRSSIENIDITKFNAFWVFIATSIGTTLATNLGAVLGITINPPPVPDRAPAFLFLRSSFTAPRKNMLLNASPAPTGTQKIQIIACWFYVFSLILALVLWLIASDRKSENIVPSLEHLSYSLIGVLGGGLTVALSRQPEPEPQPQPQPQPQPNPQNT
jgi:hypothetical protein